MRSRLRAGCFVAVVCLLGTLGFESVALAQVVSPGKLSSAHSKLEGSQNCSQCHGRRGRVEPALCLACHEVLSASIKRHKGFHASLATARCGKCHQEHRGRSFDIVRWPGGGLKGFAHQSAGYPLQGAHKKKACRDCHQPKFQIAKAVKAFDAKRRKTTFLGLGTECKTCHKDEHDGTLGNKCETCHGQRTFEDPPFFDHDKADFVLRGEHRKAKCGKCHTKKTGRSPEVMYEGLKFKLCSDCHKDRHSGVMTSKTSNAGRRGSAQETGRTCKTCHSETGWKKLRYRRLSHSPKRMALVGGHAKPACVKCHEKKIDKMPAANCKSCHEDTHKGRFGNNCLQCHSSGDWRAHIRASRAAPLSLLESAKRLGITRRQVSKVSFHEKTGFALRGLHIKVACNQCHSSKRKAFKKRFQNVKHDTCVRCHKDEHEGTFADKACKDCHTPDGWSLTSFDSARHASAKMPLEDAHKSVACNACHAKSRGPTKRFRYSSLDCVSCHEDSHAGQFSTNDGPLEPARRCDSCHSTLGFTPVYFEHKKTGFHLSGEHQETLCNSCHKPDSTGVIKFRGTPSDCGSCHADSQHEGQFLLTGATRACGDCHGQAEFRIQSFDHDSLTDETLVGAHKKIACRKCHQKVQLKSGKKVTLYRIGERECSECHESRHSERSRRFREPSYQNLVDVLLGKRSKTSKGTATLHGGQTTAIDDCATCHTSESWERPKNVDNFDHGTVGYTLRGEHAAATCNQCHSPSITLSRECGSCHEDRHRGRMGSRCAECHQQSSWRATDIRDRHRLTRLPLTGRHALTDCISCHPRDRQGQYIAVPVACVGCHAKQYSAPLTHPNHAANRFGTDCERCHRPYAWSPAYFAHAVFVLEGAHRQVDCSSCHRRNPLPSDCVGCHKQKWEAAGLHSSLPQTCADCHQQTGWKPATFRGHESIFPLTQGKHSNLVCVQCHQNAADASTFSCLAGCHPRTVEATTHVGIADYVYESGACLMCHQN